MLLAPQRFPQVLNWNGNVLVKQPSIAFGSLPSLNHSTAFRFVCQYIFFDCEKSKLWEILFSCNRQDDLSKVHLTILFPPALLVWISSQSLLESPSAFSTLFKERVNSKNWRDQSGQRIFPTKNYILPLWPVLDPLT